MKTSQKRATIYFDPDLHRALRLKAVDTDRTISDLVNEAVRLRLAEDADDLAAFDERAHEPNLRFEDILKDLKQRAKIYHPHQTVSCEGNRIYQFETGSPTRCVTYPKTRR
jgi:hypothetical protein